MPNAHLRRWNVTAASQSVKAYPVAGRMVCATHGRSHLVTLLLRSAEQRRIPAGKALHASSLKLGLLHSDTFLSNLLLHLYAKSRLLPDAHLLFAHTPHPDAASYNCLINAYARIGSSSVHVFRLFRRMLADASAVPTTFTFAGVLTAAGYLFESVHGMAVHAVAAKVGVNDDVFVGSALLNMYCKLGLVLDARNVFDRMPVRNCVSWTAMITGYAAYRCASESLQLFLSMRGEALVEVNEFAFTAALSAFADADVVDNGRLVHGLAVKTGSLCFVAVENALLSMYAKCSCLDDALKVFEMSGDKNAITWSAIVTAHAQNGRSDEALRLFSEMQIMGIRPSEYTLVGALNASSILMALRDGKQIHGYLIKLGYDLHVYVRSSLVDMYAKCGSIDDARLGFDQLGEPDLVLWSTMIGGCVQNGESEEAFMLYGRMESEGLLPNELTMVSVLRACSNLAALEPGKQLHARTVKLGLGLAVSIGSALSNMYAKSGNVDDATNVFQRICSRDVISWNSMISALSQNGRGEAALQLFEYMQREGTKPDSVTFVNLISACSHMGQVERGWSYFKKMQDDYGISPQLEHYACIVDLFGRSGMIHQAKEFIESIAIDHGMCLWRILLSAARNHRKYDVGAYAGEKLMELGSQESSAYILLSGIYAALGQPKDVERVRGMMRMRGINKDPGCSWIELKNTVHAFLSGDEAHPVSEETYAEVKRITHHIIAEGYSPSYLPKDLEMLDKALNLARDHSMKCNDHRGNDFHINLMSLYEVQIAHY